MKKKKLLAAFAAAAVLAVGGGALAGCNPKHEHTYSEDWEKDASGHWHVATCDDLKSGDDGYVSGYQEHVWGGDDECDVCHYKKEATPAANEYTITFNVGDLGTLPKGTSNTVKTEGGKIKTLPTPTAKDDKHTFAGWFDAAEGGKAVTTATAFTANATVYAHWDEVETEFTVTLDANGGTLEGEETVDLETKDGKLAELPTPTAPTGMEFVGWFTDDVGGEEVTAATEFDEDTTVYAQYIYVYTITLNAGDGTLATASIKAKDGKITELPTPTAPSGKQFVGWFTAAEGGEEVTTATEFEEDTTIYAQYASVCTVTLNVGTDGTLPEGASATLTTKGGKLESLPTPVTQNAIVFIGWFTAETDGEEVTTDTVFSGETSEVTIYARYRQEIAVTLNVGEGTLPAGASATMVTSENKLADLPDPVAPENKWFKGWYTAATDGVKVSSTTDLATHATANALTLYAVYVEEVTVTLNVGTDGTLPEGAVTSYKTVNGKIVLPEGERGLPAVSTGKDHWVFFGWYNGQSKVNVETAVFEKDTELKAKVGREDGVWVGEKFINALTLNSAASRTEYWLGGGKITLAKGDEIVLYMNGIVVNHFVEQNSAGIEKPGASAIVGKVKVSVAGEFAIYLHRNSSDWSCEYSGPTEVNTGSEVPAGCDMFTVTIGTNKVSFFLIDHTGKAVGAADFSNFCIYTYNDEIFGNWGNSASSSSATNGILKESMTGSATKVPDGWIFRWGSAYNQQTSNIISAFKAGKTYLVELKGHNQSATITELEINSIYTITFDQNHDAQPETKVTGKAYNGKLTSLPTFTLAGNEDKDLFWFTAKEGGEKVTLGTVFKSDSTVYARWLEKVQITPNYNYEGADTAAAVKADHGMLTTLPAAPTNEGYEFLGWFTAKEGGDRVTTSTVFETNSTIYAQWRVPFKVTFNLNYDECPAPTDLTANVVSGQTYSVLAALPENPTREGYEFLGWFTAEEGGDRITVKTQFTGNTPVYAQWRVPFKVTFNLNYEDCPAPTEMTANVVSGQTYSRIPKLPDNIVREGYELVGWYPNADGTGTKLSVSTNITDNTTYYALWRVPFKVTLNLNYEDCPAATVKTAKIVSGATYSRLSADDIITPERAGYDFLGWYPNADGTGTKLSATTSITADKDYYAKWREPIKVTFNLNYEGCANPTELTATLVAGQTYSRLSALPENPTREGYEFIGWYTTATTGGTKLTTSTNLSANATYYARWKEPTKITFDLNYTDSPAATVVTLPSGTTTVPEGQFPADPVREGFTFAGWYSVAAETGGRKINTNDGYLQSTTVYARWTPVTEEQA